MLSATAQPIRVLIADNHEYFRMALRQICDAAEDMEVVGESKDGDDAVALARELQPDVIIMDIRMPVMDGIVATSRIVTESPITRVMILTLTELDDDLYAAVQAGARCYLLKEADAHMIVDAIRAVHRGEAVMAPVLLAKLFDSICARSVGPAPG